MLRQTGKKNRTEVTADDIFKKRKMVMTKLSDGSIGVVVHEEGNHEGNTKRGDGSLDQGRSPNLQATMQPNQGGSGLQTPALQTPE